MPIKKSIFSLPITLIFLASGNFVSGIKAYAGAGIGVDIYCIMRQGGNSHETSWKAAYQSIKGQKAGLFKTSPKQAATMIVEEVVREPDKYDNCVGYLGDLFYPSVDQLDDLSGASPKKKSFNDESEYMEERYGY